MITILLPAFRDGLGVGKEQIAAALGLRSLFGATGPFLAYIAETRGRKVGMLAGMFLFSSGIAIVVVMPTFWGFALALVISTLGKYVFDPAMQAYLGDRIPYKRRGFILALVELGWSGAFLVGVPLVGVLIARAGWLAPFLPLSLLGFLALFAIYRFMPRDVPKVSERASMFSNFAVVFASSAALAGLTLTFLVSVSNEQIFLILGIWLEDSFGLQIAALGAITIVIGLAELGGEGLVSGFVDRLGKRRAVAIGPVGNSLAAVLLPILGVTLLGALFGLFLFFISFEFTFVSSLPLMSEVVPERRATFMALMFASASVGRGAADFIGIQIFSYGFLASAMVAACVNALALLALRGVRVAAEESS